MRGMRGSLKPLLRAANLSRLMLSLASFKLILALLLQLYRNFHMGRHNFSIMTG